MAIMPMAACLELSLYELLARISVTPATEQVIASEFEGSEMSSAVGKKYLI